jgi:dienelactone hydrolase
MPFPLISRRDLLRLSACLLGGRLVEAAAPPEWIEAVSTPPEKIPQPRRPLADLLANENGAPIRSVQEWEQHRKTVRAAWTKFLNPLEIKQLAFEYRVVSTEQVGQVVRQKIAYLAEPDLEVPACLLFPEKKQPDSALPGIVALHPTTAETIEPIAGLSGPAEKQSGLHLAQAGFVVLCPENFLWQNAANYNNAVDKFQKRHPGSLGMSKMLWDAQRAVDILQTVPGVDSNRIGTFGHSLGAKEVLYLAAFDDRIKASVFSEGGIAFDSTNWDAPWYLGKGIHEDDFSLDHHQLLALIAPRPFLVLAGEQGRGSADGLRSWPYVAAAQRVYGLYNHPHSLALFNHGQGHSIPQVARARAIEWLRWGLA